MLHKPDTLVILTPGFPENEADTTCLPSKQTFIKELRKSYPSVKIIVLSFQYPHKKRDYTWNGIPVKAFGGKSKGKLFRVYNWLKVWHALKEINKANHVMGLFSFWMGECAFIGHWFAKMHHLKHHCWICGQDAKPGNTYFSLIRPKAGTLVVLSDFLAKQVWTNYGILPAHVIPGGLDDHMFGPDYTSRPIDVLSAGSLIPLKQYHLFIEVVARLKKSIPNINAVLCGDGPEREHLTVMIKRLDLVNNITLTGNIPHNQVLNMMQQAKVFLHTSNYEGQGMVMIEALYAGAKVVSLVRPFDKAIKNWYIAQNTVHMTNIILTILHDNDVQFTSVAPFMIADTTEAIVKLYDRNAVATWRKRLAIASKESVA